MTNTVELFPEIIYETVLDNADEINAEFEKILFNDDLFTLNKKWNCIVETSKSNDHRFPWNVFLETTVQQHLIPFIETHLQPKSPINILLRGVWCNRYKKNFYQELHNHVAPGHHFSCNYIVKTDTDCGDFLIKNEKYDTSTSLGISGFLDYEKEFYRANNAPGNLIIFPSYLKHLVTANQTENLRATISANFEIVSQSGILLG